MILLIDNNDSFTYNIYSIFICFGFKVLVLNFFPLYINLDKFSLICFGPGTGSPLNYPSLIFFLFYIIKKQIPILGICLGHQIIGYFFNFSFSGSTFISHGLLTKVFIFNSFISFGIPSFFYIVKYNSLVLYSSIYSYFVFLSFCSFGDVMILQHKFLPILGIQFHPDSFMCTYGIKIIRNFFILNEIF